jgi:hypothetical protein
MLTERASGFVEDDMQLTERAGKDSGVAGACPLPVLDEAAQFVDLPGVGGQHHTGIPLRLVMLNCGCG